MRKRTVVNFILNVIKNPKVELRGLFLDAYYPNLSEHQPINVFLYNTNPLSLPSKVMGKILIFLNPFYSFCIKYYN